MYKSTLGCSINILVNTIINTNSVKRTTYSWCYNPVVIPTEKDLYKPPFCRVRWAQGLFTIRVLVSPPMVGNCACIRHWLKFKWLSVRRFPVQITCLSSNVSDCLPVQTQTILSLVEWALSLTSSFSNSFSVQILSPSIRLSFACHYSSHFGDRLFRTRESQVTKDFESNIAFFLWRSL